MRFLLLAVCALFILSASAWAQDAEPPIPPRLQEQLDSIESAMVALRQLQLQTALTRNFPNRDDLRGYLRVLFEREYPPEVAEQDALFYRALGFLTPDIDLRAAYLEIYNDQVAGFYDVDMKTMNVVLLTGDTFGDALPFLEEVTYAHEFVHALQDQNFDLAALFNEFEAHQETNPDAFLAFTALVEGDATLAMSQYMNQRIDENPVSAFVQLLLQSFQLGGLDLPPNTPDILRQELLFPYETGLVFVSALYLRGGWPLVDAAFTENPPQSTEQILHPERYFNADMPQPVALPPATGLDALWQSALERTVGEFYLRAFLATELPAAQAATAAEGWGGDMLRIYQHQQSGAIAWVWRIVWDDAAEAQQFAQAYTEWALARFATPLDSPCWAGDTAASCLVRNGATVTIASAPDLALAQSLAFLAEE